MLAKICRSTRTLDANGMEIIHTETVIYTFFQGTE
jgi:hypothetical protein